MDFACRSSLQNPESEECQATQTKLSGSAERQTCLSCLGFLWDQPRRQGFCMFSTSSCCPEQRTTEMDPKKVLHVYHWEERFQTHQFLAQPSPHVKTQGLKHYPYFLLRCPPWTTDPKYNSWGPTVYHRELYAMLCGYLSGSESSESVSCSVLSDSLQPHELYPAGLLCP